MELYILCMRGNVYAATMSVAFIIFRRVDFSTIESNQKEEKRRKLNVDRKREDARALHTYVHCKAFMLYVTMTTTTTI